MYSLVQRCRPLFLQRDFRVVLVLNILLGLAYSFVVPFMSMFGTIEAGMSPGAFSVFMTCTAVAGIGFGTVLAHYSDVRYSRRSMLLLGSASGAIGYIGFAFVRDYAALLLIGALVLGISSITFSQVFALAREHLGRSGLPKAEGPFYMNAFRMFFALSWTVGPAIASWMMVAFSYTGLFLAAAACFAAFFGTAWFFVPASPRALPSAGTAPRSESVVTVLRRPDVFAHFAGFVLIFASGTIGMMNLPLLAIQDLGGNEHHVGIIYSIAPVFELPLMLYFGLLASRQDPARIIRLGVFIAIAYYALLAVVRAPWHIYPIQVLSAAVVAVTSGVAITYFQNYLPHHPGSATNLYATAQRIGSTLGYLLFGTLSGNFGHRGVFIGCTLFSALSLALLYVPARPDEPDPKARPLEPTTAGGSVSRAAA